MSNLRATLTKNLKPYSRHIPEINKATMRSMLKRKFLNNFFNNTLN